MKNKLFATLTTIASLSIINQELSILYAQGTAFTYQGRLGFNGAPANGVYDFDFALYATNSGGSMLGSASFSLAVPVTNGLFTTTLDFGGNFSGAARWLEIAVRTNGGSLFSVLTPRQPITPAPYAISAGSLPGLLVQQNTNGTPNVIGGSQSNFVSGGVMGATIAGGGWASFPFGTNKVTGNFGTVSGGYGNTASGANATVGGGADNTAEDSGDTVGGGVDNRASGGYATVGGGSDNLADGGFATVGGGRGNTANGAATVGGGEYNVASGANATVAGGILSTASGDFSFAAGNHANAKNDGSFVWADNNNVAFSSTTANQFRVRATGGAAFVTAIDASGGVTAGVHVLNGDSAWSSISDKNAKKNFQPVDGEAVLEKLTAMPVQSWNYKWEADTNTPHLGPMAQDFKGAFYPGRDDKSISTLEFDGVELAAIQGLNRKLTKELEQKQAEITELRERLERLELLIRQSGGDQKAPGTKLHRNIEHVRRSRIVD